MQMFEQTHFAFMITTSVLVVLINSILFLDTYFIISNPFFPKEKRVMKYNLVLLLTTVIVFGFSKWIFMALHWETREVIRKVYIIIFGGLYAVTLVAAVMTLLRLTKPGTSR